MNTQDLAFSFPWAARMAPESEESLERIMLAGLTAGSAASIVAVLVSLPLRSPSDTLFNSASVTLAALLAGLLAGVIWLILRRAQRPEMRFLVVWSVTFLPLALVIILIGRSQLDHFTAFAVPLALIIYLLTGVLTISIPRYLPNQRWWCATAAVVTALVIGLGLVTQTDQESGKLELPPPGSRTIEDAVPVLGGSIEANGNNLG